MCICKPCAMRLIGEGKIDGKASSLKAYILATCDICRKPSKCAFADLTGQTKQWTKSSEVPHE